MTNEEKLNKLFWWYRYNGRVDELNALMEELGYFEWEKLNKNYQLSDESDQQP